MASSSTWFDFIWLGLALAPRVDLACLDSAAWLGYIDIGYTDIDFGCIDIGYIDIGCIDIGCVDRLH